MTSPAAGDTSAAERRLHEVWQELTGCGLVMDQPRAATSMCAVHGLRRAHSAVDLLAGGAMVWEFIPLAGTVIPGQVARMVGALLGGTGPASPGQPPAGHVGAAMREVVGRVLTGRGLAVQQAYAGGAGDVWPVSVVTSPPQPARGHVCIGDEGDLRWECSFTHPGRPADGLAPATIGRIIATALAAHRAGEHDAAGYSLPRLQDLAPWTRTSQTATSWC
jgi:hypothetical protein